MPLVPTICGQCWHVQLASLTQAQTSPLRCGNCGGVVRVVPGRSFPETDRDAFEELGVIVAEAKVTPIEARSYAAQLEQGLWSGALNSLLADLSVRLPGFLPHEVAAGKNPGAQRSILSKLKAIFDALGTARPTSSEYPIVPEPRAPNAKRSGGAG